MSRHERLKLVLYAVGIAITTAFLATMFDRAWGPNAFAYQYLGRNVGQLGLPAGEAGIEAVASFGFGLYLGLLGLFANDVRKRVQGLLLFGGTVIVIAGLAHFGIFLPNLEYTAPMNWLMFATGIAGGLLTETSTLSKIDLEASRIGHVRLTSNRHAEFSRATLGLYLVTLGVVVSGFLLAIWSGTAHFLDFVAVVALLVILKQFLEYESDHEYQVLGPGQSGKSMFQLGLYLERLQRTDDGAVQVPPRPSSGMRELLKDLDDFDPSEDGWPTTSNELEARGLDVIGFEYVAGDKFPIHVEMTAVDHAGQHLKEIADTFRPGSSRAVTDGGTSRERVDEIESGVPLVEDEEREDEEREDKTTRAETPKSKLAAAGGDDDSNGSTSITVTMTEFVQRVSTADTLVVLLDCERLTDPDSFNNPSLHTDELDTIVQNSGDADVLLVASKADVFLERWQASVGTIADPAENPILFDDFRDDITDYLQERQMVQTLMQDAQADTVHPVYFQTEEVNGKRVPKVTEGGQLVGVGFDRVLDKLEEDL